MRKSLLIATSACLVSLVTSEEVRVARGQRMYSGDRRTPHNPSSQSFCLRYLVQATSRFYLRGNTSKDINLSKKKKGKIKKGKKKKNNNKEEDQTAHAQPITPEQNGDRDSDGSFKLPPPAPAPATAPADVAERFDVDVKELAAADE
ncbi:hypothetical protein THAOC_04968 [Thalassiosira oceanica]|uniref:RxLR effector protein n=1 Tax=Thalassiosira oceanica TaxID=159749 RepID=K0T3Y4_THAOC|nr:hypothetical protein THAOC_04968 [Thalassiosira oceanica]|eukprot:EJK73408.1 hypothetical protein THAOC_04968 [Thalassiosira oceanica]